MYEFRTGIGAIMWKDGRHTKGTKGKIANYRGGICESYEIEDRVSAEKFIGSQMK